MKISKTKLQATYNSKSKLENSIVDHFIKVIEAECGKLTRDGQKVWESTCKIKAKEVIDSFQADIINMVAKKADKVKFDELLKLKKAQTKALSQSQALVPQIQSVLQNNSVISSTDQTTEFSTPNQYGGNNNPDYQD